MRADRLLAETIYLLEHGRVPARELARRFEVSVRTVLRDMEALGMAGIPVMSFEGAGGGFALEERYRLDHRAMDREDVRLILTALRALSTAVQDQKLLGAIEKFQALGSAPEELRVDLSALGEDRRVQRNLRMIQAAIQNGHAVKMRYVSAAGRSAEHTVEPLYLEYKWYAWYLCAWSRVKQQALTYKLVRMDWVVETDEPVELHPGIAPEEDGRPEVKLKLRCREEARVPLIEYLHVRPQRRLENGDWLLEVCVPVDERFWRGVLLSLGDAVEVLSPPEVIAEFRVQARAVLRMYEEAGRE